MKRIPCVSGCSKPVISTAQQNNSNIMIEESAVKIISGTSEIYKPDEIENSIFIAKINLGEAGNIITKTSGDISLADGDSIEKVKMIMDELDKVFNNNKVIPSIIADEFTDEELIQLLSELPDWGYNSYIIK